VKIDVGIDYVLFGRHNKSPKDDNLKKKKEKEKKNNRVTNFGFWYRGYNLQMTFID
jgi:hypothetical protein